MGVTDVSIFATNADRPATETSKGTTEKVVKLNLPFTILKQGDDWQPRIKPGADHATFAYSQNDRALAAILAEAVGLPAGTPCRVVGVLTLQIDNNELQPDAVQAAILRGKAKAEKDAANKAASDAKKKGNVLK